MQQGQVILEDEPSMAAAFSLDMAKLILGWKVITEVLRSTIDFKLKTMTSRKVHSTKLIVLVLGDRDG